MYNVDPTVAPYFSPQVIRAERLLGLRMKAASRTCYRAYWAINMHKRDVFWSWDYPFGRNDVLTRDMIDMDQAGMKIEASSYNRDKN